MCGWPGPAGMWWFIMPAVTGESARCCAQTAAASL